jgi:hypothetical protein
MAGSRLIKVAWRIFAIDVALGAVLIIAALTDTGDPAGRPCAGLRSRMRHRLAALRRIRGLNTYLRSTIGLWVSIGLTVTPAILFVVGVATRVMAGW